MLVQQFVSQLRTVNRRRIFHFIFKNSFVGVRIETNVIRDNIDGSTWNLKEENILVLVNRFRKRKEEKPKGTTSERETTENQEIAFNRENENCETIQHREINFLYGNS